MLIYDNDNQQDRYERFNNPYAILERVVGQLSITQQYVAIETFAGNELKATLYFYDDMEDLRNDTADDARCTYQSVNVVAQMDGDGNCSVVS